MTSTLPAISSRGWPRPLCVHPPYVVAAVCTPCLPTTPAQCVMSPCPWCIGSTACHPLPRPRERPSSLQEPALTVHAPSEQHGNITPSALKRMHVVDRGECRTSSTRRGALELCVQICKRSAAGCTASTSEHASATGVGPYRRASLASAARGPTRPRPGHTCLPAYYLPTYPGPSHLAEADLAGHMSQEVRLRAATLSGIGHAAMCRWHCNATSYGGHHLLLDNNK